jgi:hypothetical protein
MKLHAVAGILLVSIVLWTLSPVDTGAAANATAIFYVG